MLIATVDAVVVEEPKQLKKGIKKTSKQGSSEKCQEEASSFKDFKSKASGQDETETAQVV